MATDSTLLAGLDAVLDEAQGIVRANDVTSLPPWAQQVCALLGGAWTQMGAVMKAEKVADPDASEPKAIVTAPARQDAAAQAYRMANGSYPISDQHSANSAWKLRGHSNAYSEAQVVAHIRLACSKLGLKFPGARQQADDGDDLEDDLARATAADLTSNSSAMLLARRAHGFVYPSGLPKCALCGEDANHGLHVNPPRMNGLTGLAYAPGVRRIISADLNAMRQPRRAHVYSSGTSAIDRMACAACRQSMSAGAHTPGMPVARGAFPQLQRASVRERVLPRPVVTSDVQRAFVTMTGDRVVITGTGSLFDGDLDALPREVATEWERASAANPMYLWVEGKYVEAERANRNNAFWTHGDLQIGEPTVAHGPVNWLHQEHHVIGTIAAAKLVGHGGQQDDRQAANERSQPHIRSLAAIWGFLFPGEARTLAAASDDRKLFYSMECISKEVACLAPGCDHVQPYRQYVSEKASRCPHVRDGGPRRFVNPSFLGGAMIVPPVRPGWAGANATVMRQAAAEAERQQASLVGLSEEEAVSVVAQVISYGGMQR